jgi:hypothetical protein
MQNDLVEADVKQVLLPIWARWFDVADRVEKKQLSPVVCWYAHI